MVNITKTCTSPKEHVVEMPKFPMKLEFPHATDVNNITVGEIEHLTRTIMGKIVNNVDILAQNHVIYGIC